MDLLRIEWHYFSLLTIIKGFNHLATRSLASLCCFLHFARLFLNQTWGSLIKSGRSFVIELSHLYSLLFQVNSLCQELTLNDIRIVRCIKCVLQLQGREFCHQRLSMWVTFGASRLDGHHRTYRDACYLSELALCEDGAVPPLPSWQREARPGRQQGRGKAGMVTMGVTMGVWQPGQSGTEEGEYWRPRAVQASAAIGRQIHSEALIGRERRREAGRG